MQKFNFVNVLNQSIKPSRLLVILKKIVSRFLPYQGSLSKDENLKWIKKNVSEVSVFANTISSSLWEEAISQSNILEKKANKILKNIEYDLGGGAAYPLLYFLTRYLNPDNVLETGVAAGFSSYAILSALHKNGKGMLYSSDFPYFRIKDPEKYIGIVVEEKLRNNWHLFVEGDQNNLKKIFKRIKKIDMFSYDSDKTYSGRSKTLKKVSNLLNENSVIIMDDIQDNSFFYDFIKENNISNWKVFEFQSKYLGIIGKIVNKKDFS